MLAKLLKGTAWSELSSYLSPTFFEVVPPFAFLSRARQLATNYTTRRGFKDAEADAQALWNGLPPQSRGDAVLQLYFAQLARLKTVVLDLRHDSFEDEAGSLAWKPGPLFVRFESKFLEAVRNLYAGFYGDDDDTFDQGLSALGLHSAKDLMRRHFGGDPSCVTFSLAEFRDVFHQIFLRAKTNGITLDPDFLPFGSYLACLYEHLERLGGAYDVKAAYLRALA